MTEAELLARIAALEDLVADQAKKLKRVEDSRGNFEMGHLGVTLKASEKVLIGDTGAAIFYNGKSSRNSVHLVIKAPKDFLVRRVPRIQDKKHGS